MRFRDISISWKLTLLAVVTTLLSMVTVISTESMINRQLAQMAMVENYVSLADVLGQNCLNSLEQSESETSKTLLNSLRKDHLVVMASLFNSAGQSIAALPKDSTTVPALDFAQKMNGTFSADGFLHIVRPIRKVNQNLGHLYMKISVERLASRWWDQVVVAGCMFVLTLLMAIALATRLQRLISGPVLHLVDTTDPIIRSGDYSVRAEKETDDELGDLVDRFNQMLTTIESRGKELDSH